MKFVDAAGMHIPVIGLGTWELRGARLRAARRAGGRARLPPFRHRADRTATSARWARACAPPASSARRSSSSPRSRRPILRRRISSARSRKASAKLQLDEIDLLLLHWPNKGVPLADTIDALVEVKSEGSGAHIGVSNYTVALLEEAMPAVGRAARLQSDRSASLSRPDQGDRGLPQARHGGGGLFADRRGRADR